MGILTKRLRYSTGKDLFPTLFMKIPFTTLSDSGNYLFRKDKLHILVFHVSEMQIRARYAICKN